MRLKQYLRTLFIFLSERISFRLQEKVQVNDSWLWISVVLYTLCISFQTDLCPTFVPVELVHFNREDFPKAKTLQAICC